MYVHSPSDKSILSYLYVCLFVLWPTARSVNRQAQKAKGIKAKRQKGPAKTDEVKTCRSSVASLLEAINTSMFSPDRLEYYMVYYNKFLSLSPLPLSRAKTETGDPAEESSEREEAQGRHGICPKVCIACMYACRSSLVRIPPPPRAREGGLIIYQWAFSLRQIASTSGQCAQQSIPCLRDGKHQ